MTKPSVLAPPIDSRLDSGSEMFVTNRDDMLEQIEVIEELLAQAYAGGGERGIIVVDVIG